MLCLVRRATQFLELLQATKELNNLERDANSTLSSSSALYGQIYADLMILMKLTKLSEMYLHMCVQNPA